MKKQKEQKFHNSISMKKEFIRLPAYLMAIMWTVFIFFMIGWVVLASFSTTRDVFKGELLAGGATLANYIKVLVNNKALLQFLNSCIYTISSCVLIIIVCAPAAYCMSRFRFRGNALFHKLIVIGLAIPGIMIIMPLFSIVNALKLSGTRFTLIFLYIATSVPYTTFFLMAFFRGISSTYEEAAAIDGCGPVRCFWSIMFPLAKPAVVTVTIFNFISKWNEYFMALIFANKTELRSVGVGLRQSIYAMMNMGDWAGMFAAVVVACVPTVIIYVFLSDKIISGVTAGGIKG